MIMTESGNMPCFSILSTNFGKIVKVATNFCCCFSHNFKFEMRCHGYIHFFKFERRCHGYIHFLQYVTAAKIKPQSFVIVLDSVIASLEHKNYEMMMMIDNHNVADRCHSTDGLTVCDVRQIGGNTSL
jgi:hypothetical protein